MGYCTAQTEGDRRNCHRQIAFAQVSSGYAPISVRLVEAIAAPDGAALATALPQVPGLPHLAYAPRAFSREELGCAFDDAGAGVLAAAARAEEKRREKIEAQKPVVKPKVEEDDVDMFA